MEQPADHCKIHPNRALVFACLESTCTKPCFACFLCVQEAHARCPEDSIVERVDLKNLQIDKLQLENISEKLHKIFLEKKELLSKKLDGLEQHYFSCFGVEKLDQKSPEVEVNSFRRAFRITPEEGKLSVFRQNVDPKELQKIVLEKFEADFKSQTEKALKNLRTLRIKIYQTLSPEKFLINRSLVVKEMFDGIEFSGNGSSRQNCLAVIKEPESKAKYKIMIKAERETSMVFGVMTQESFETVSQKLIFIQSKKNVWALSPWYVYGFKGKGCEKNRMERDCFKVDTEFTLFLDAASRVVSVTTKSGEVDVQATLPPGKYHFFVSLSSSESRVRVNQLI